MKQNDVSKVDFSLGELVVNHLWHITVKHFPKKVKINLLNSIIIILKPFIKHLELKELTEMPKKKGSKFLQKNPRNLGGSFQ